MGEFRSQKNSKERKRKLFEERFFLDFFKLKMFNFSNFRREEIGQEGKNPLTNLIIYRSYCYWKGKGNINGGDLFDLDRNELGKMWIGEGP